MICQKNPWYFDFAENTWVCKTVPEALPISPGDVRGLLMRSPEDRGCEGPPDALLILLTNAHYYLSLIIVTSSYTLLHYITIYH